MGNILGVISSGVFFVSSFGIQLMMLSFFSRYYSLNVGYGQVLYTLLATSSFAGIDLNHLGSICCSKPVG